MKLFIQYIPNDSYEIIDVRMQKVYKNTIIFGNSKD